jgi:CRP/FNR family transcriptional regulator
MSLPTFEPSLQKEIETKGRKVSVKAGEIIVDHGQIIQNIPLVISGTIKVSRVDESGKELLLYYVNPSESCAMTFTCCMDHKQNSEIKAVAEDDVEMIMIPSQLMDEWMTKYPSWKSYVMRNIQTRFDELLKTIDHIAFDKMDERLIHYLKEKSKAHHSPLLNVSHQQIADELATSREVVSRLLKKLENDKKLLLYRNQIKLLSEM